MAQTYSFYRSSARVLPQLPKPRKFQDPAVEKWAMDLVRQLENLQATHIRDISTVIAPAAIPPGISEQTFIIPGITANVSGQVSGDKIIVSKPSFTPDVGIVGWRVPSNNLLDITFISMAGAAPPVEKYTILAVREELA